MFDEGVIDEVRAAEAGPTAAQSIGYAEIKALLRGEMSVEDCMTAIQQRTRRYAKRQLTWLRRENIFFTINLTDQPQSQVADAIAQRIVAGSWPDSFSFREPGEPKPRQDLRKADGLIPGDV